jgi:hypothetical protein
LEKDFNTHLLGKNHRLTVRGGPEVSQTTRIHHRLGANIEADFNW